MVRPGATPGRGWLAQSLPKGKRPGAALVSSSRGAVSLPRSRCVARGVRVRRARYGIARRV
eukprot:10805967-Lingulodinium_polyedra.AAC.1